MTRRGTTITCPCGTVTNLHARGLCNTCWVRARNNGTLANHPRRTRPYTETIEDLEWFHQHGIDINEAARRLGMQRDSLRVACARSHRPELYQQLVRTAA